MGTTIAPLQGFGNPITESDVSGNVFFAIEYERDFAMWQMSANIKQFPIPGSFPPRVDTQLLGYTPATVTWQLALDSLDDYRRLVAMLTTEQTLTIVAGLQSHPGTYREINQVAYEELSNTTLMALTNVAVDVDGYVQVDATFQRIVDPTTSMVVP